MFEARKDPRRGGIGTDGPSAHFEPPAACLEGCPRLLMFTGKGGVGKTTCAAAAAIRLAGEGRDTLLFSTDPAHSVSDSLGANVGPLIRAVGGVPHLWALEIDAAAALDVFRRQFGDDLRDLILTATYLDDEDAESLLELQLPGLDEIMGLYQIFDLLAATPPRFHHLVWDSAPTGHTLRLLELPAVMDGWVRALAGITWKYRDLVLPRLTAVAREPDESDMLLALKRTIRQFTSVLRDPARSRLIPVTTAEPMAGAETLRLVARLTALKIPLRFAVINGLHPPGGRCAFCTARHKRMRAYLEELAPRLAPLRLVTLEAQPEPVRGIKCLGALFK
ncbi:MAG TPA: ArsA family ATPase [Symbiobacteriaceae bacterium]|jgi:arsenite-transporting ATPase